MRREDSKKTYRQLDPEFATGIRRLSALVFDIALVVGLLLPTLLLPLWRLGVRPPALTLIVLIIVTLVMSLFETKFGKTPGKYVLGIRVVKLDSGPLDLRAALVRNVMRIYDVGSASLFSEWLVLIGIFVRRPLPGWASGAYRYVWSDKGQRWGDELAGTYVIRGQWKPVRFGSRDPASSIRDAISRSRVQYQGGPSGDIRLSKRKPEI